MNKGYFPSDLLIAQADKRRNAQRIRARHRVLQFLPRSPVFALDHLQTSIKNELPHQDEDVFSKAMQEHTDGQQVLDQDHAHRIQGE